MFVEDILEKLEKCHPDKQVDVSITLPDGSILVGVTEKVEDADYLDAVIIHVHNVQHIPK